MRAVAPGKFRILGRRGKEELAIEGLVLPAGWTIKIVPAQVAARPHEVVAFRVQAIGPTGTVMKDVPFALFPQEFERLPPESKVIGPWARFGTNETVEFTALAPGETTMIATIGQKRATAKVVVIEILNSSVSFRRRTGPPE